jgi:hypothetical protein
MQGIITKYLGPTNHVPSRVKAYTTGSRQTQLTFNYNSEYPPEENHRQVAAALAAKLYWCGEWYSCDVKNGYVFVRVMSRDVPAFILKDEEA